MGGDEVMKKVSPIIKCPLLFIPSLRHTLTQPFHQPSKHSLPISPSRYILMTKDFCRVSSKTENHFAPHNFSSLTFLYIFMKAFHNTSFLFIK